MTTLYKNFSTFSLLLLLLVLVNCALAGPCGTGTGNIYDSTGTYLIVGCNVSNACPPTTACSSAGATYSCPDNSAWTCLVPGATPRWTRGLPPTCTSSACTSGGGTNWALVNVTGGVLGQCSTGPTTGTCPDNTLCCKNTFDSGSIVTCTSGPGAGQALACMLPGETPSYQSVCNAWCGNNVGTVGSTACSSNCPAAACCALAGQQGSTVSCASGPGAGQTLQCTTPGPTPVFTPVPVTLACPSATQAVVNVPYSSAFTAGGGSGKGYNSYTLQSGSFPTGLSLNSATGALSGTPSALGTYTFAASVKDSVSATANSATCTITVVAAPTISCPAATTGQVGIAYSSPFTVFGGASGARTFTLVSGSFPSGLTLSASTGTLSGTPAAGSNGGYSFSVKVTDSVGGTATSLLCTLSITAPPAISCPGNLNAATTYSYSGTFGVSGGTSPLTCSANGTLPAGLSLSGCTVSGTLTATSNANMCVIVKDALNASANRCCTLTVVSPPSPNCFALANANVNKPYNNGTAVQLTITGGSGSGQQWTPVSGVPSGMTLSSLGLLSGTPTQTGTFSVCFTVCDSITCPTASAQKCCTLTVATTPLGLSCPSPLTGAQGVSTTFQWSASGGSGSYTYTINTVPSGMSFSTATGALTGTPSAAYSGNTCVTVTDAAKVSVQSCCVLNITGRPALACPGTTLEAVNGTTAVSFSFTPSGGSGSGYTCAVSGTLPAGLSLSSACAVTGTPTGSGSPQSVCATVTDGAGAKSSPQTCCSVTVYAVPVANCPSRLVADATQAYAPLQLTVTGGKASYTWGSVTGLPSGMTLNSTGTLAGTPASTGSFNVCFTVTDSLSVTSAQKCCTLVVNAALTLGCPSNIGSQGEVGAFDSWTWQAGGGSPAYTFSINTTIPGLSFNTATGTLSGTPTTTFNGQVLVTVTDTAGVSVSVPCTLVIIAGPQIQCPGAVCTQSGVAWSGTWATSGGTAPLTCAFNGTAPSGFTISGCTVSGTVTSNTQVCVKVTDARNVVVVRCCNLTVVGTSCPSPFYATQNQALNGGNGVTLVLTGTTGGTFTLASGGNCTGLSVSAGGVVTGTITLTPPAQCTVCYNYSNTCLAAALNQCCTINVTAPPVATCSGPFSGNVNVPASFSWGFSNAGAGISQWQLRSGTLPSGMTLNAANGVISGTPTAPYANAQVCLAILDLAGTLSANACCNITIAGAPTVTCVNAVVPVGTQFTVPLTTSGGSPPLTCSLNGTNGAVSSWGVAISAGCSLTGTATSASTSSNNNYTVKVTDSATSFSTARCTIKSYATGLGCPTQTVLGAGVQTNLTLPKPQGSNPQLVVTSSPWAGFGISTSSGNYYLTGMAQSSPASGNICWNYTSSYTQYTGAIQRCCPFTVAASAPATSCPASPSVVDVGYTTFFTFTATNNGGGTPLTWAVDGSNGAAGLAFSSNTTNGLSAVFSLAATTVGDQQVCVRVTDKLSVGFTQCCPITVYPAVTISCPTGAPFILDTGNAWSGTWSASGGQGPLVYSSTSLLNGMSLDSGTGAVTVTSLAQGAGNFSVCVKATDPNAVANGVANAVSACCPFRIAAAPVLACPVGTTKADMGNPLSLKVTLQGGQGPFTWTWNSTLTTTAPSFSTTTLLLTSPSVADAVGSYSASFSLVDGSGTSSNTITCNIAIAAPPTPSCTNIAGFVGVAITPAAVSSTGGTAPVTLSVSGLPSGLTLSGGTQITGTVSAGASGSYTLTAKDGVNVTSSVTCTYTISPFPLLACPPKLVADLTFLYTGTVTPSGGTPFATPPLYTLSNTSALPPGLAFNVSTGVVRGTPTSQGTFNVGFQVVDAAAATSSVTCQFIITAAPTVQCPGLPALSMSLPMTGFPLTFTPGSGSPTFALQGAPPGLFVDAAGTVRGTPSSAGSFTYSVSITDSAGNTVTATGCTVTVQAAPTVSCPTNLQSTLTTLYNQSIPFTSSGSFSITLASGGLPAGLSITNPSTGNWFISGIPTSVGSSSFVLAIRDNTGRTSLSPSCPMSSQAAGCTVTQPSTPYTHETSATSDCSTCSSCARTSNPCFAKQCQLNTVLILDNSNSMTAALTPGVRTAVSAFVQGLLNIVSLGGSAQLGLVSFDTGATVQFEMQLMSPAYVSTLNTWISNTYLNPCCKGNTNWALGLKTAFQHAWTAPVDIYIMYTDGKPESVSFATGCADDCFSASNGFFNDICNSKTVAPIWPGTPACAGQTAAGLSFASVFNYEPQGLWAACPWADQIKASGAKLFLVGVGDVTANEDEIQVITGTRAWDGTASTFFQSDYIISQSYSDLLGFFSNVIQGLCPCLSTAAKCEAGGGCAAQNFDARVIITTRQSASVTFPQYSVLYAAFHYAYSTGGTSRAAFEFFPPGIPLTSSSFTPMRTDILNPCQLQRRVACSAGCFLTQNKYPLPRFFREVGESPGVMGAINYLPITGCTGYTKAPVANNPEAIKYIWVLTSDLVTPCAAEAYDGTFYQFYQNDGVTRGVSNLGLTSSFNFQPAAPPGGCQAVTCSQPVDLVFVIDEQTTVPNADLPSYKQFVNTIINLMALTTTPPSRFAIAWACTPGYTVVPPIALQSTTLNGFVQTTLVSAHTQRVCSAPDFASIITQVVNTVWASPSSNAKRLITLVGGPDGGTDPTRFTTLNALLDSMGVERWAFGVNKGATDATLLAALGTGANYAHFTSFPDSVLLPPAATTEGLLVCPPSNLCGSSCSGFCSCIQTCTCTSGCTQDLCSQTRTCDAVTKGCSGAAKDCSTGNLCIPYGCDPVIGCTTSPIVCDDGNNCTIDSCDRSLGTCVYSTVSCNDNNPCTTDVCPSDYSPPGVPCQHIPYSGPGTCNPGNVCPNSQVCDDLNACTVDTCDAFSNCVYTPATPPPAPSLCSLPVCDNVTGIFSWTPVICDDQDRCTKDSCNPATGQCVYTPLDYYTDVWLPANPPPAKFCKCNQWTCTQGTWTSSPVQCTNTDSCLTVSCDCDLGCVTANITCPLRTWLDTGACEWPSGCIGTGPTPQCLYTNITSLFDFCGRCLGDNVDCFVSSVLPVSSVAAITGGAIAGVVIACIIAALIVAWVTKKGYEYFQAKSALSGAGLKNNPFFKETGLQGSVPETGDD